MHHANAVDAHHSPGHRVESRSNTIAYPANAVLTSKELADILHRNHKDPLVWLAGWMLRLEQMNDIYGKCYDLPVDEFLPKFFETVRVDVSIDDSALECIPTSGPVVVVANHPLGAIDGLAILMAVRRRRPDAKIIGNSMLQRVKPFAEALIRVDPFEQDGVSGENLSGIRQTLRHVQQGNALIVFPAGEVSSKLVKGLGPVDRQWDESIMKIIQRTNAEVVPAFISGRNSSLFYAAGRVHPRLRTVLLPTELLRKRDSSISISLASPISRAIVKSASDPAVLGRFLRSAVYLQSPAISGGAAAGASHDVRSTPVAEEVSSESVAKEIASLEGNRLLSQGDFDVFLMQGDSAPNILHEIGRLREITFSQVGEGTGTALDIDSYDRQYEHLVLWHRPSMCIAGAYRLGHGGRIMSEHGISGMYSASLFHFDHTAQTIMRGALELGRSFVRSEFQRQRLPLHLLWRGILTYLIGHPELNTIVGCVSMSDRYRDVSKEIIGTFFMRRAETSSMYGHVHPRTPFRAKLPGIEIDDLLHPINDDLRLLDKLIAHIEPDGSGCPILLKKYAQQNGQIVAFNVDAAFSNALDGFMVLSLSELSEELRCQANEQVQFTPACAP